MAARVAACALCLSSHRLKACATFAAGLLAFTGSGFSQKTSGEAAADRTVFEKVCGTCHPTTLIDSFRSEPDWKETVAVMVSNGAKGTDEEFARVMRFLLRNWTRINVNTAKADEISAVLDISDASAQTVVSYRVEHGPFKTIDDLKRVPGIEAAKLAERKDRITF